MSDLPSALQEFYQERLKEFPMLYRRKDTANTQKVPAAMRDIFATTSQRKTDSTIANSDNVTAEEKTAEHSNRVSNP